MEDNERVELAKNKNDEQISENFARVCSKMFEQRWYFSVFNLLDGA
jgi:hypothetical protein